MCFGLGSLVTNWEVLPGKTGQGEEETGREKPNMLSSRVPGNVTWAQSCRGSSGHRASHTSTGMEGCPWRVSILMLLRSLPGADQGGSRSLGAVPDQHTQLLVLKIEGDRRGPRGWRLSSRPVRQVKVTCAADASYSSPSHHLTNCSSFTVQLQGHFKGFPELVSFGDCLL